MAPFFARSEYQIGRGEVPESQVEAPVFVALIVFCMVVLLLVHFILGNPAITLAAAISMLVFSVTVLRVDFGVYFLVLAMLLSPEISGGLVGTKSHELNLRYDDVLIFTIFLGVMVRLAWEGRPQIWRPNPINIGIVLYYFICVVSTLRAIQRNLPYFDIPTSLFVMGKMLEFYLIFFLVGNAISNQKQIRRQIALLFLVMIVVAGYAMYMVGKIDRVGAPFEQGGAEPNTLGGYLTLVMSVAGGLYVNAPSLRKRVVFLLLIATAFTPFLFTLSRASYLALTTSMILLGILGKSRLILGAVIVGLIISPYVMPEEVKQRVNYTFQQGSGVPVTVAGKETNLQVDKSTYERIYVWKKAWFNLKVWPFLGGGVAWGTVMDSQYARVIIETGLLGLAAFLFMQYRIIKTVREASRWSRDWFSRGVALGTLCGMLALIVHSLGTISFLIVRIMEPFWFLVALCVVIRDIAINEYRQSKRTAQQAVPDSFPKAAAARERFAPAYAVVSRPKPPFTAA